MADKKTLLELLVNSSDGLDSLSVKELDWMGEISHLLTSAVFLLALGDLC